MTVDPLRHNWMNMSMIWKTITLSKWKQCTNWSDRRNTWNKVEQAEATTRKRGKAKIEGGLGKAIRTKREEEFLLSAMIELVTDPKLKLNTGAFRNGFFVEVEKKLVLAFPVDQTLRSSPHIESKSHRGISQGVVDMVDNMNSEELDADVIGLPTNVPQKHTPLCPALSATTISKGASSLGSWTSQKLIQDEERSSIRIGITYIDQDNCSNVSTLINM
ncbi:hypothetical protein Dimus_037506, partial [Dionaea muscipula]